MIDLGHFVIQEFVPPEIYKEFGDSSIQFIDSRIIITANMIRDHFNSPVTINNWHTGGSRKYSGFRPSDCVVGAKYGQHRFGRAIDALTKDVSPEEARQEILKNRSKFPHITAMEKDVDWLHVDCRNVVSADGKIMIFSAI